MILLRVGGQNRLDELSINTHGFQLLSFYGAVIVKKSSSTLKANCLDSLGFGLILTNLKL